MGRRVVALACYRSSIQPAGGPYAMSHGRRYREFVTTVVKVTADDGTVGWGEASTLGGDYLDGFPGSVHATVRELAPIVLACDPLQAQVLSREMDNSMLGHYPGKAAIDIAMWDLRSKMLGVPAGVLLGGIMQTSLDAFTAVRVGSEQEMTAEAQELVGKGYKYLQIKVGDDPAADAERVRAVVSSVGQRQRYVCCDANRGWTVAQALRFARSIGDLDTYLEQPCPSIAELAQVRAQCSNPIVIDEAAVQPRNLLDAVALGCVNAINIKPVRVGGLTKAAIMRDIAQAAGLMILADEPMGGALAGAGIIQLAATVDPQKLLAVSSFSDHADPSAKPDFGDEGTGQSFHEGRVSVPLTPGLGVNVDEEALGEPAFVVRQEDLDG
jgi:L-alanine-DL-glutamate epimerase-like enolase superfamily enzyme